MHDYFQPYEGLNNADLEQQIEVCDACLEKVFEHSFRVIIFNILLQVGMLVLLHGATKSYFLCWFWTTDSTTSLWTFLAALW